VISGHSFNQGQYLATREAERYPTIQIKNYYDDVFQNTVMVVGQMQIPVTARSKVWVCARSLAGIAGSNPAADIEVCLL